MAASFGGSAIHFAKRPPECPGRMTSNSLGRKIDSRADAATFQGEGSFRFFSSKNGHFSRSLSCGSRASAASATRVHPFRHLRLKSQNGSLQPSPAVYPYIASKRAPMGILGHFRCDKYLMFIPIRLALPMVVRGDLKQKKAMFFMTNSPSLNSCVFIS